MSLTNKKYGAIIFGLISLSGFILSLIILSTDYSHNDLVNMYAMAIFGISFIPSFMGIGLGIKAIKVGNRAIGIMGMIISLIIPLFVILVILYTIKDTIKILEYYQ